MKKKSSLILCAIVVILCLSCILFACNTNTNNDGKQESNKQIPVYQGMSIESAAPVNSLSSSGPKGIIEDIFKYIIDGDYFGRDNTINENDPFEDGEDEDIEEEIKSSLDVIGATESIYYATLNEEIYIKIHINNPDNFEILSFTLNGKKYTSYMFEQGSDMENIILKYNVGDKAGLVSYTIDAIKYIDGTEIKDVLIDGDKTVKAGIYEEGMVKTTISNETISTNGIKFDVNVKDNYELLKINNSKLYAMLYDGTNIIEKVELNIGANSIDWKNLKTNTLYQYGIAGYYDNLNGNGVALNVLNKKAFYTNSVVLFNDIEIGKDTIKWNYLWDESAKDKNITSLKLYKGKEEKVLDNSAVVVDKLLSNTEYKIVAEYVNLGKKENISLSFKTKTKVVPSVEITNVTSNSDSISFEITKTDIENILTINSIEIKNGIDAPIVAENVNIRSFNGLKPACEYKLIVTYEYDLNDGLGAVSAKVEKTITTWPKVTILNAQLDNTENLFDGSIMHISANINNPNDVVVKFAVINGKKYAVNMFNNQILIDVLIKDQFDAGENQLVIEQLIAEKNGETFKLDTDKSISVSATIYGKLEVLDFTFCNQTYNPIEWCFKDDKVYGLLTFNSDLYKIDSVSIEVNGVSKDFVPVLIEKNKYYVDIPVDSKELSLKKVTYSNSLLGINNNIACNLSCSLFRSTDNIVHQISTVDDLKNVQDGYYYEIINDIDLSGQNWIGTEFVGIINGNGHIISNMTNISTIKDTKFSFGLFSEVTGLVYNIKFTHVKINIDFAPSVAQPWDSEFRFGVVTGTLTGAIENCSIDANSYININSNGGNCYIGGFVAKLGGSHKKSCIKNCVNSATIIGKEINKGQVSVAGISNREISVIGCVNNGNIQGFTFTGGICGFIESGSIILDNCINNGNVIGESMVGGIVGADFGKITNCINNGKISGTKESVGGICGDRGDVSYCVNNGEVIGPLKAGGIVGGDGGIINNCLNNGNITGSLGAAGITSSLTSEISNCINTGTIKGDNIVSGIFGGNIAFGPESVELTINNCVNIGKVIGNDNVGGVIDSKCNDLYVIENVYSLVKYNEFDGAVTIDQLNTSDFYINVLNMSENIWDFTDLDVANGKYPKLKTQN